MSQTGEDNQRILPGHTNPSGPLFIGCQIAVFWPEHNTFYSATVVDFLRTGQVSIVYDGDDDEEEDLYMEQEIWEFATPDVFYPRQPEQPRLNFASYALESSVPLQIAPAPTQAVIAPTPTMIAVAPGDSERLSREPRTVGNLNANTQKKKQTRNAGKTSSTKHTKPSLNCFRSCFTCVGVLR